jgi:hypothetical protein
LRGRYNALNSYLEAIGKATIARKPDRSMLARLHVRGGEIRVAMANGVFLTVLDDPTLRREL